MKDVLAVYGGCETTAQVVDGLAIKVELDVQDDCTLISQAWLIVNEDSQIELDLNRADNQALTALAVGRKYYYPRFGV